MLKQTKKYSVILMVIFFYLGSYAIADTANNKESLLYMINQIRTSPFSHAVSLGYGDDFLVERGILPETELKPYTMDDFLNSRAADANGRNMAGDAEPAENGEPVEIGPVHLLTAEVSFIVSFFNFMSADIAGQFFIDNLFKKELESKENQIILSDDYSWAGIAIEAGVTEDSMNAWFFTISLGSSMLRSEVQVLNLINQVRSEPSMVEEYINTDVIDNIVYDNWSTYHLVQGGYKPLFLNSFLHKSAVSGSFYMLNETYPDSFPLTVTAEMSPWEMSLYYGYSWDFLDESSVIIVCAKDDSISCVNTIFSYLVLNELNNRPDDAVIFSDTVQDAGPGLAVSSGENFDVVAFSLAVGSNIQENAVELDIQENAADLDIQEDPGQTSRIYGILFLDSDGNNFYSPGEEIAKENVIVYDEEMNQIQSIVTDNAGHFSITLDSNKSYFFKAVLEGFSGVSEDSSGALEDFYGIETDKVFVDTDLFVKLVCTPLPL